MGPQEKRLTSQLAIHLVRSCSRAAQHLPPGVRPDLDARRRWFEQAYREWQLTPRVELAGRSPYEVISAERAALRQADTPAPRTKPTVELYTDLPTAGRDAASPRTGAAAGGGGDLLPEHRAPRAVPHADLHDDDRVPASGWQGLAQRLFGSWLDDKLDQL